MPRWADKDFKVPDIAVSYWNMPEGKRTMKDLILYIRADEAGHVSLSGIHPRPMHSEILSRKPSLLQDSSPY